MGKGSKSTTVATPSRSEKALQSLLLRRATNPNLTDRSALAQAMQSEAMGRFYEPAPLDPRVAGILSHFMPQMTVARETAGGVLDEFLNAPSAVPLGVSGAGTFSRRPVDLGPMVERDRVLGSFSEYLPEVGGIQPDADVQTQTRQTGRRLSQELLTALLGPSSPGAQTQSILGSFVPPDKDLWKYLTG